MLLLIATTRVASAQPSTRSDKHHRAGHSAKRHAGAKHHRARKARRKHRRRSGRVLTTTVATRKRHPKPIPAPTPAPTSTPTATPTPPVADPAPAMPTGLVAQAGDRNIVLDWNSNREADIAGYRIYHRLSGGYYDPPIRVTGSAYTQTGLTNGVTQIYSITAVDTAGHESLYTNEVRAIPTATAATSTPTPSPTPTPTPASSSGAYWGARMDGESYGISNTDSPWSSSIWNTFESHAGKPVSIVHFGQPFPTGASFDATPFNLTTARGAIPLVSYALDDLTGLKNGAYDAKIKTWASGVKAWGKPFWLRFDWEMNGTWYSYGSQAKANPQLFVDAWRHFHDVVAAAGASNATWAFCPNVEFGGSTPIASLYPGDAYVDWNCMDGYNFGTNPLKPAGTASFSTVFKATYDRLLAISPSKPILIAETGSTEYGSSKAAWIADALKQLPASFPKIRGLTWFNWNIYADGGRWDWPIESSSSAQSAFAAGIASSYYKRNDYALLPAGSKVPVP
jgi:hypothetical protein